MATSDEGGSRAKALPPLITDPVPTVFRNDKSKVTDLQSMKCTKNILKPAMLPKKWLVLVE